MQEILVHAELEFEICKKHNITLYCHDYNEPQRGKDQADRESAIAKRYMTKYVIAGKKHNFCR